MHGSEKLIIFTRFPVPGEAKTRLIPALGAEGAADLQREMTEHTVRQARKTGAEIEIRYTGGSQQQMLDWLGDDLQYADQGGGDLGERMTRAFQEHFDSGAQRVVIIGCDCPSNHWKNIRKSFQWLEKTGQASSLSTAGRLYGNRQAGSLSCIGETSSCVIGPASDGGYYLIGLARPMHELFQGLEWGTETVLKQTLAAVPCKPALLPELHDVDLPEDIPAKISVIIPTLNEEKHLFQTLEKVKEGFHIECIAADGGSTDGTEQIARQSIPYFNRCGNKGRAAQMNAGAAQATGEILLFLHADTELPDNWDFLVRDALGSGPASRIVGRASLYPESLCSPSGQQDTRSRIREACPTRPVRRFVALGAFRFQVKERLRGIGLVEWGTNLRSKFFRMPYGDQGLFLRKETFEQVGGFPEQPILEDVELVRRARKLGKIVTLDVPALTSGRRWSRHGVFRTTLVNQLVLLGAALGVSTQKLRRLYG